MRTRPYVVYPPDWPHGRGRARAFGNLEAARRYARKLANERSGVVEILLVSRFGGGAGSVVDVVRPSWERDPELRTDVDLAQGIGLEV